MAFIADQRNVAILGHWKHHDCGGDPLIIYSPPYSCKVADTRAAVISADAPKRGQDNADGWYIVVNRAPKISNAEGLAHHKPGQVGIRLVVQ
jgi:hypothetical protein